jgi:hypothetical protein
MSDIDDDGMDRWVKAIGTLHRIWAIVQRSNALQVTVYFQDELGGIFDELTFSSLNAATTGLQRNNFEPYPDSHSFRSGTRPPSSPFYRSRHPSGRIYSSGLRWKT